VRNFTVLDDLSIEDGFVGMHVGAISSRFMARLLDDDDLLIGRKPERFGATRRRTRRRLLGPRIEEDLAEEMQRRPDVFLDGLARLLDDEGHFFFGWHRGLRDFS